MGSRSIGLVLNHPVLAVEDVVVAPGTDVEEAARFFLGRLDRVPCRAAVRRDAVILLRKFRIEATQCRWSFTVFVEAATVLLDAGVITPEEHDWLVAEGPMGHVGWARYARDETVAEYRAWQAGVHPELAGPARRRESVPLLDGLRRQADRGTWTFRTFADVAAMLLVAGAITASEFEQVVDAGPAGDPGWCRRGGVEHTRWREVELPQLLAKWPELERQLAAEREELERCWRDDSCPPPRGA